MIINAIILLSAVTIQIYPTVLVKKNMFVSWVKAVLLWCRRINCIQTFTVSICLKKTNANWIDSGQMDTLCQRVSEKAWTYKCVLIVVAHDSPFSARQHPTRMAYKPRKTIPSWSIKALMELLEEIEGEHIFPVPVNFTYTRCPTKKRNSRYSRFFRLCSDQQSSFFTLLDRASFSHYNNTKIIKFGWELFISWVISYGLSFSGFARFPEFRGTINDKLMANPENDSQ